MPGSLSARMRLSSTTAPGRQSFPMAKYSTALARSVLRHKDWLAEHTAQIETELATGSACVHIRGTGLGMERGRDRCGACALRPGRCPPLALARGRGTGFADRQGPRPAARRTVGDP